MIPWKVTDYHFCNYKNLKLLIEELEMHFLQMDDWMTFQGVQLSKRFLINITNEQNVMFPPKTDLKPAHNTFVQGVLQSQTKGMTGTSSDGLLPVKHTGHLKVPPMPSKLCSIR